ncbi:MAG: glycosyltransferase [Acidobacteria bacterium]|nr:glycosyltransferase [Acidobacteriota bacterium]
MLSSRHEGISIAILEAMRAGLPVVATRVGGVPETVVDGVTGRLVEPDDADALADTIVDLLATPANMRSMGDAGRAVQNRRFSIQRAVDAYAELYGDAAVSVPEGPLRVLYHHRTQGRGAEGVHITRVVRALEEMGHDVTVVGPPGIDVMETAGAAPVDKSTVSTRGASSLWEALSRHAPTWLFEFAEIAYNAVAAWRLRQAWKTGDFDVIYERYAFFLVAGARFAARRDVPFVLEANEVNGLEERARRQAMPVLCGRFEQHLFARCNGIMAVSSYLRNRIVAAGVHPRRVQVVPNAIEPDECISEPRSEALVARYGIGGRTVVGFAGWFDHWDRLDLLLESIAALRERFPGALAMFVGDGPIAPALRDRARELGVDGDVIFTGAVPRHEMSAHLGLFDVAVLPHSNRFGSPVVLFEFFARGLPVVAPRLAPITDVVHHGVNGMMFEPLDRTGLTTALAELLGSRESRMRIGRTGRDIVLKRHTWHHNASAILETIGHEGMPAGESEQVTLAS